jgi:4-nitrophenyl phosphatase
MQRLGTSPEETLVVGDRLNTDIQGGQNSGCKTAMVLTGVNTRADAKAWHPNPDLVLEDVSKLFAEV